MGEQSRWPFSTCGMKKSFGNVGLSVSSRSSIYSLVPVLFFPHVLELQQHCSVSFADRFSTLPWQCGLN